MNKVLLSVFRTLGMTLKHVRVYESLLKTNNSTPLSLARETGINRSSIYRYLEDLKKMGLVEEVMQAKSTKFKAAPIENLDMIVSNQEDKLKKLQKSVPILISELKQTNSENSRSEVKYFQGVDGLKSLLWNVVSSGLDYSGLGYQDWNTSVGKTFAEKLREKHIESGAMSREILNEVDDSYEYTKEKQKYTKTYQHRAIDKNILEIRHDTYIYGDVFAYYYHYGGEYFGVEIHNEEIAKTEKQIFEILWKMAR